MKALRVLIVRIGAMGDVLHAMPAVAALRVAHPEWFIGWAIEPRWSDLLPLIGDPNDVQQLGGRYYKKALVDRWYQVPASEWKQRPLARKTRQRIADLRRVLRDERFDICVDMQGSLKSAVVGRMAKAPVFAGPAVPREKIARLFYNRRVEQKATHVVEQGCELLSAAVGETLTPTRVRLPMEDADEIWVQQAVEGERFCLISPGGGWGAKVWPPERFGAVAAALGRAGVRSLVNATPGGSPEADRVAAAAEGFARVLPCTVGQMIPLIRRASLVIGGDTGPVHLAAVLEKPVVGIFGPTDPARNGPYGNRQRVLRDASSTTSHKRVKEPEPGMLKIGVDEVVAAALEMLG